MDINVQYSDEKLEEVTNEVLDLTSAPVMSTHNTANKPSLTTEDVSAFGKLVRNLDSRKGYH